MRSLRRIGAALAVAAALVVPTALPASAGSLPIPDPFEPTNPLDPVIALLPSRPVPYHPYAGPVCTDGSASCIVATIAEMQQRTETLAATCDHDAVFSLAYLRVTQNVKDAVDHGYFHDPVWLRQIDADFAGKYFDTLDRWAAGNHDVPPAWQVALQAAHDGTVTGLGDFMLGMNAHINNDFANVLAEVGLTAKDGTTHKPDHNAYNQRLDTLYAPVFAEEARRFDPHFDDIDVGPADEDAAKTIMRGWREMVWRYAEALSLAKTPAEHDRVEHNLQQYALAQARMIKVMFHSGPATTARRDAYCATHHR